MRRWDVELDLTKHLLWGSIFPAPHPQTPKTSGHKCKIKISDHFQNKTIKVSTSLPKPQIVKHCSAGVSYQIGPYANKHNFSNFGQKWQPMSNENYITFIIPSRPQTQ